MQKAKEEIYNALFNADDLKGVKEALTEVFGVIQRIVKAMDGIKGILLFVGTIILDRIIPTVTSSIVNLRSNISGQSAS